MLAFPCLHQQAPPRGRGECSGVRPPQLQAAPLLPSGRPVPLLPSEPPQGLSLPVTELSPALMETSGCGHVADPSGLGTQASGARCPSSCVGTRHTGPLGWRSHSGGKGPPPGAQESRGRHCGPLGSHVPAPWPGRATTLPGDFTHSAVHQHHGADWPEGPHGFPAPTERPRPSGAQAGRRLLRGQGFSVKASHPPQA